jgi:hypothetical protein
MAHNFEHRSYMIFNVSELNLINFNEVLETSINTVRKSIDGTKTLVKWDSETTPTSVQTLTTKEGPYNHSETLTIMATSEWSSDDILP